MTDQTRHKVIVRCQKCKEKYILRGRHNDQGELVTGFVRCVCGNEKDFYFDITPE